MTHVVFRTFAAPLIFCLLALLICWLYYARRKLWPDSAARRGKIYRCTRCGHVYVNPRDVPMARCPQCDHFNEAVKR